MHLKVITQESDGSLCQLEDVKMGVYVNYEDSDFADDIV